ncbi:hypothetical protein FK220_004260 [Flavobacteriaceae bacterium TP-CH-4]|uniref:Cytochrome c domain-containing protein n=1 Tax=Pelagihabitans pacificus TaxID=2696054 RepID=A0A967ARA0_9FLAO|nr:hypothetical protein [Pelagihabitans pacificus]NHF58537.1 hypothetical protein [Pelagihabitans pacificus]
MNRFLDVRQILGFLGVWGLVLLALIVFDACKESGPSSAYVDLEPVAYHENGQGFVGSESCRECHADLYRSHMKTAHHRTSSVTDSGSVRGNFEAGRNTYNLNDSLGFRMVADPNGWYQESYWTKEGRMASRDTLDIVIGSGTKG